MTYEGDSPQATLRKWERQDVEAVRIVGPSAPTTCGVCQDADGTVYSLERALREQPLPHKDCALRDEGCCCAYAPLYDHPSRPARPCPQLTKAARGRAFF
jgi:hypothetical protein